MNPAYKIAVLGPIPRDHINTHEGLEVNKYGCALYTAVVCSTLVGERGSVVPVTHIRKVDEAPILALFKPFANIDISRISSAADQGDVISLNYVDQNKRLERQTGFMKPIYPEDLDGLMDADAFVFVPVTDFEVSLDTLREIKAKSEGVIIFDAHGPTNTCSRKGERSLRFWIDRDRWLPYIDILKMNLEEAACSWFNKEYDPEEIEKEREMTMEELPLFAAHCLDQGIKALYVTLDELGCAVYFKNKAGQVEEHLVPQVFVEKVVDTTGAGDSFAGGIAVGYLKTLDYVKACQYGNAVGAQRVSGTGLAVYKSLAETEQQILETYGS